MTPIVAYEAHTLVSLLERLEKGNAKRILLERRMMEQYEADFSVSKSNSLYQVALQICRDMS